MIVDFVLFIVLLLGGFWLFGLAQVSPVAPGLVFVAGILAISVGLAYITWARGGATNRGGVAGSDHRES